jgi:murein DD-endopeptidase MepM/ murein hydrolase activator NlpD
MTPSRYYNRDLKYLGREAGRSAARRILRSRPRTLLLALPALVLIGSGLLVGGDGGADDKQTAASGNRNIQLASIAPLTELASDPSPADSVMLQPQNTGPLDGGTAGKGFGELLANEPDTWHEVKVKRGDTLYLIFKRLSIDIATATFIASSPDSKQLTRLVPGRTLYIRSSDGRQCDELVYEASDLGWVHGLRNEQSYQITSHRLPTTVHLREAAGTVNSSLFEAGKRAGLSNTTIMNLTEIFGWDIDFAINVQPGDQFKLIYQDIYVNGEKRSSGDILAAEFVNDGKVFRAFAHHDDDGRLSYYAADGASMQKAFLRSPVKFSRISSGFTRARYHPVLKKWRAHKGVDYAASSGTPVRATADGKVTFVGRKGGYGKVVILSHGSTYTTLYAHLSRFAKGIRQGSRVQQGQVIGKVGATGLASGPHLHYEFRVNGKHINPLAFKQPKSEPIAEQHRHHFTRQASYWSQRLDTLEESVQVASTNTASGS